MCSIGTETRIFIYQVLSNHVQTWELM
ncbi:hypothetical protein D915_004216 [Fasciola hepatica]|uniref:Uncharacterized protein n=1 Tax=Fasciola hepatica TaxID=6192 RepID=A0A4E0RFN5_FASHE|nr:hypothetical protein D915_004216 [Fasciola hepatica]